MLLGLVLHVCIFLLLGICVWRERLIDRPLLRGLRGEED